VFIARNAVAGCRIKALQFHHLFLLLKIDFLICYSSSSMKHAEMLKFAKSFEHARDGISG